MKKTDIEKLRKETEEWLDLYSQLFDIIDKLQERYEETKSEKDKEILQEWLSEKKAYDRLIEEFSIFTNPLKERVDNYLVVSKKIDTALESDEIYSNSRDISISDLYSELQDKITADKFVDDNEKLESINTLMGLIEDTATEDYKQIEESGITKRIPTKHLEKYEALAELRKEIMDNEIIPTDDLLQALNDVSLNNTEGIELESLQFEEIDKNDNNQVEIESNIQIEETKEDESEDKLYEDIVNFVKDKGLASITSIQKQFHIGHKKASEYIKLLEKNGIVGPSKGRKPREVLALEKKETEKKTQKEERIVEDYHIGDDVFGSTSTSDDSFELLDDSIQSILDTETLFDDSDKAKRLNDALNVLFDKGETRFEITKKIGKTEESVEEENPIKFKLKVTNRESVFSRVKGLTLVGLNKIKSLSKKAINSIRKNRLNSKAKNSTEEEITNVETPKNKKSLKKKIIIGCGAVALAAITVGSAFAFKACSSNDKKEDGKKTGITIETLPKNKGVKPRKPIKDKTKNDPSEKSITNKHKSKTKIGPHFKKVLFGKKIKIKKGSPIYTNAYDVTNHNNGMKPHYSYKSSNDIVGVVLENNNNIVSFVSPDNGKTYEFRANNQKMYLNQKEVMKKVKDLEQKGYHQTAVAVKNVNASSGVTGFYNVDSIGGKTK